MIINEDGLMRVWAADVHTFQINQTIPYRNLLRKWSKLCVSYDFEKNEAQAAFNGRVSTVAKDPESLNYMLNTFDAKNIADAAPNTQFLLIIGRYYYDENPFIGRMANVNVWSRTMNAQELEDRTRNVSYTVSLKGNSRAMFWRGPLVYHIFTHDHRALWEAARFGP